MIVAGNALAKSTSVKKRFHLQDKVKPLAPPGDQGSKPRGAPLKIEIFSPEDGQLIPTGKHMILVDASAKNGLSRVELKIDGPEPTGNMDITGNFAGSNFCYEWDIWVEGQYVITSRVFDNVGKSKEDINTVNVGESTPGKWALLIGIADYEGSGSDLWHPDEDAKEMEKVLLAAGYPRDGIKLLLNRKATARNIEKAVDWLISNEKSGDEVVFFFSGHGSRISDTSNWDSDFENDGMDEMIVSYDFRGFTDGWLRAKFSNIDSTSFSLMFGSCHSGGMFDDDDDLQGPGRVIVSACKADQYGWDYMLLGNTLWGYYFIDEGLIQGNADSVESAHNYASPLVILQQPDSMPQIYDNYGSDFYL
jgi:hypothetical protein